MSWIWSCCKPILHYCLSTSSKAIIYRHTVKQIALCGICIIISTVYSLFFTPRRMSECLFFSFSPNTHLHHKKKKKKVADTLSFWSEYLSQVQFSILLLLQICKYTCFTSRTWVEIERKMQMYCCNKLNIEFIWTFEHKWKYDILIWVLYTWSKKFTIIHQNDSIKHCVNYSTNF